MGPLNDENKLLVSTEANKYAKLMLDGTERMFVIHKSPLKHHNKSYDYENNNKYRQKPEIQEKSARRKCRRHSIFNLFYLKTLCKIN